jgi:PAS domain S-box-containing protein
MGKLDPENKSTNPIQNFPDPDIHEYRQCINLFDRISHGFVLVDSSTWLPVEFNSTACEILGYKKEEFKLVNFHDLEEPQNPCLSKALDELARQGMDSRINAHLQTKTGETRILSVFLTRVVINGRNYFQLVYEDITEKHHADEINRAEREIFEICNNAGSKTDLIHSVLTFFRTFSGCDAVGIRIRSKGDFPYYETTGFPEQFVELERSLCGRNPDGTIPRDENGNPILECMCGNIIRGLFDISKPFFTSNGSFWSGQTTLLLATSSEEDRLGKTRNRCNSAGYESVALIPIRHNQTTYGLVQFNDKRFGWHTEEKILTLERLIDYVAIALAKFESDEALFDNEQDFKQILNSTTEAILIHDSETGNIIDVNDTMLRMFGFSSKAEALEHTISDFSDGDKQTNMNKALALVQKASKEGPQVFEWLCRKTNGKTFWAEVVLSRSLISGKNRILAVVRDISERKRMEEALSLSTGRYHLLFDEMIEGFALHEIILDPKGRPVDYRFLDVNPAFELLTGLKKTALIGHTVKEVMPGTEDYWIEKYGDIALHGGDLKYENYAGELGKWFQVSAYCPKFGQFATVFEDITIRKVGDLALQESEEQFRSTFEQTSIGMCIVSMDGFFRRVNDAFCKMVGYSSEELIGLPVIQITHPDDHIVTSEKLRQPLENGNQYVQFDKRYIHKNGTIISATISSTLVMDSAGKPRHFVTQVQDVTAKKRTEEALQLRDKIFTHSLDMLFIAGFDGYFKVLNPAWEATLGWDEETLLGKPWIEFVHPEDKLETDEVKVSQLSNGTEVTQFENRYLCKDGNYRWLSWNSFPYPEENIIVGVARDVTERKALDESLRLSEERYKLIDEASSDSIYSYDLQGRFTHVNTALCKMLGLSPEQIKGKTHRELGFPEAQCVEWETLHSLVKEKNETITSETTASIDNDVRYFEVVLDPIHDSKGEIIGIAGTTRDIDARKKAELKVMEQMEELRRWNAVTLGRETRVIELKQEVNQLLEKINQPPRYHSGNKSGNPL